MLSLKGRVAIVTGASRGIGRAIAQRLAAQGAHVVAAARGGNARPVAEEIAAAGGWAEALALDVTEAGVPEAAVAIQISGSFGSRQEEAQRLGRLLRPKHDGRTARFYAVVARDTLDQEYAAHRQRFLAEQGYAYRIVDADDVLAGDEI